jgi:hypothetical protein
VNWPKIDKEPISTRFWQASEQDFYSHVKGLQDIVSGLRSSDEVLLSWSNRVRNHAINIFDSIIDFDAFSSETMSIVAEHRADLMKKLNSLYRTRKEDKSGEIKVQEW